MLSKGAPKKYFYPRYEIIKENTASYKRKRKCADVVINKRPKKFDLRVVHRSPGNMRNFEYWLYDSYCPLEPWDSYYVVSWLKFTGIPPKDSARSELGDVRDLNCRWSYPWDVHKPFTPFKKHKEASFEVTRRRLLPGGLLFTKIDKFLNEIIITDINPLHRIQASIHRWWGYYQDLQRVHALCNAILHVDVDFFDLFFVIFTDVMVDLPMEIAVKLFKVRRVTEKLYKATPVELENILKVKRLPPELEDILETTNLPEKDPIESLSRDQLAIIVRSIGPRRKSDHFTGIAWEWYDLVDMEDLGPPPSDDSSFGSGPHDSPKDNGQAEDDQQPMTDADWETWLNRYRSNLQEDDTPMDDATPTDNMSTDNTPTDDKPIDDTPMDDARPWDDLEDYSEGEEV